MMLLTSRLGRCIAQTILSDYNEPVTDCIMLQTMTNLFRMCKDEYMITTDVVRHDNSDCIVSPNCCRLTQFAVDFEDFPCKV